MIPFVTFTMTQVCEGEKILLKSVGYDSLVWYRLVLLSGPNPKLLSIISFLILPRVGISTGLVNINLGLEVQLKNYPVEQKEFSL